MDGSIYGIIMNYEYLQYDKAHPKKYEIKIKW